jgi:WD40 repeat protein
MWDVQTGGLTHTFATRSEITDVAVSTTGDHIACGSSDGSVIFWNIHTKAEGKSFRERSAGCSHLLVVVLISSRLRLRQPFISTSIASRGTLEKLLHSRLCVGNGLFGGREPLVGTSLPGQGAGQQLYFSGSAKPGVCMGSGRTGFTQLLKYPGNDEATRYVSRGTVESHACGYRELCASPHQAEYSGSIPEPYERLDNPPLLDAAMLVAVSLNRNLVVQTKDSIQIFSA